MSAPIPIKKEENNSGGYFTSWFAKKQKEQKENLEEEIFSMDDDELPFEVTPNPPTEDDLNRIDSSEEEYFEEEACFGFPCSNNIYHGYCKKCEEDSICNLIYESAQQGFEDMKSDIHKLWEKDVVKVWTAFLTVCYFNIPNEAIFLGVMYLVHKKFEEKEMTQTDPLEEDEDEEEDEEEEEKVEENKKCV
jgi:hypothetical protein